MSKGKANRYVWEANEEEALLNILDELVTSGQRCDAGTFKAGTMKLVETRLRLLIPHTPIRVKPHLDSKLKRLKKDYSIVVDMLNQSGFAWNDEKKCVEVDSDEVWKAYVEHHSDAAGWRDKSFAKFDRLRKVFGKDRATGNSALAPAEMVLDDDDEASESNIPDVQLDGSHHTDQTQAQSKSSSSRNKRVRQGNKMVDGLGRIANAFESMMEDSDAKVQRLVESLKEQNADDDLKFVGDELKKMEFSISDRISLLTLFTDSAKVRVFKTLDEGDDRYEYVTTLLRDYRSRD
ncbi:unnamed protein product [Prunus brigantina]